MAHPYLTNAWSMPSTADLLIAFCRLAFRQQNFVVVRNVDKSDTPRTRFVMKCVSRARIWWQSSLIAEREFFFIPCESPSHACDLYRKLHEDMNYEAWLIDVEQGVMDTSSPQHQRSISCRNPIEERRDDGIPSYGGRKPPSSRDGQGQEGSSPEGQP